MKSNAPRAIEMMGFKASLRLAAEIRRRARDEERTVSNFLRRVVSRALLEDDEPSSAQHEEVGAP